MGDVTTSDKEVWKLESITSIETTGYREPDGSGGRRGGGEGVRTKNTS